MTPELPLSSESFKRLVQERLHGRTRSEFAFHRNGDLKRISAVLFLLGRGPDGTPWLILNKRSRRVRQPGDLCCPGGGVAPILDPLLSRGLRLPATPLSRWPQAAWWQRHRRKDWPKLALLLATALREGAEEMRLNPFGVSFLGPMQAQQLIMFRRHIYPLVGWVNRQRRFFPNWEVDRIVRIPVAALLDGGNYGRFHISLESDRPDIADIHHRDMPCFVHRRNGHEEMLWGATYRITEHFLRVVFGFIPPSSGALPVFRRRLGRDYIEGGSAP